MSPMISLADLTVANDGPVDRLEYARRSAMAAKSLSDFTTQAAGPALDALIAVAEAGGGADLGQVRRLADELSDQAATLLGEVERFTAMAERS